MFVLNRFRFNTSWFPLALFVLNRFRFNTSWFRFAIFGLNHCRFNKNLFVIFGYSSCLTVLFLVCFFISSVFNNSAMSLLIWKFTMIWKFCLMIVTHFPNSTLKSANGIFLYRILLRMSFTFWQILLLLITNARFDSKQLMLLKCLYHHNLSQPVLPMLSSKVFKHYALHPHFLVLFNAFSLPVCPKALMVK